MRELIVAMVVALTAAAAQAQPATLLKCSGYNATLGAAVIHDIEIDGASAKVDNIPYVTRTTGTSYLLTGPLAEGKLPSDQSKHLTLLINRKTGEYLISSESLANPPFDWSRVEDRGCEVVSTKP
ncbi:MAG TPA: hypothetical protein VKS60_13945 [Stellaceae bacterium]|nr:hypothetical protein [Stellaceae bacterium]